MARSMTITEKIMARAAGKDEVKPGDIINAKIDLVYTMDFLGKVLFEHLKDLGVTEVFDQEKVVVVFDHLTPPSTENAAELQKYVRNAVKKYGGILYDVGRHGIMHQMVVENGHVLPGNLVVGTDSHTPTAGAMGAVVAGVGATDAAVAMATGELWLRVPEQVKVLVKGEFKPGVGPRDLVFNLMKQKGWDGSTGLWAYKSIEFTGEVIDTLNLDKRLTATNLIADMGAKNAIMEPNKVTIDFINQITDKKYNILRSDQDAEYYEVLEIDASQLEPSVACPHSPDNVKEISEVEGTRIDQAIIASCSNARISDLREAAELLKGNKVASHTRLIISPASQAIYQQAIQEGLIDIFIKAGALVGPPSCGPCYGAQMGLLASGEVCITTTARNMQGRMGSKEAEIYSASPKIVAASAVKGEIADPRNILEEI